MKRIMVLMMFVLLLTGCKGKPEIPETTDEAITILNENSSFEYDLLTPITNDVTSNFHIIDGFGEYTMVPQDLDEEDFDMYTHLSENETTFYKVTSYPDVLSNDPYITTIITTEPSVNVYELFVGKEMTSDDLDEYMEDIGYVPVENRMGTYQRFYTNNSVSMRVYLDEGIIVKLIVEVEVTNEEGVIF